jgi:hypothetical protein
MIDERDPVQGELGAAPVPFPLFEGEGDDQLQANAERSLHSLDASKSKWKRMVDSENYVALSASSPISPKVNSEDNGLLQRIGPRSQDLAHRVPLAVPIDAAATKLKGLDRSTPKNRSDGSGGMLGRRESIDDPEKVLNGSKEKRYRAPASGPPTSPRASKSNPSNTSQGFPKDPSRNHATISSPNTQGPPTAPRARTAESNARANHKGPQQQGGFSSPAPIESKSRTEVRAEEPQPAPELEAKLDLDPPSHPPPERRAILKLAKPSEFCTEVESIGKVETPTIERIAKAEKEGHPVLVESSSICKQECTELKHRAERLKKYQQETIVAGLVGGCAHSTGIKIPCLAKGAPEEVGVYCGIYMV